MDVNTSVSLTAEEEAQLAEVLRCPPADLNARLVELGRASLREYVDMLLSQAPLRSPDNREHRLLLMTTDSFNGTLPKAADVARWFNLTLTGANALLRKVLSRYHLRLEVTTKAAATVLLQACAAEADGYRQVTVANPVIVEYLNDVLAERNGDLKRIRREPGTGTSFLVPEDSYQLLIGVFPV